MYQIEVLVSLKKHICIRTLLHKRSCLAARLGSRVNKKPNDEQKSSLRANKRILNRFHICSLCNRRETEEKGS